MYTFFIVVLILTLGLPPLTNLAYGQGWLPVLPSFLFESTWLVAFVTAVLYLYLHKSKRPSFFVQLYLLSMAVKLIAFFAYTIFMILEDRDGAVANVLYFLAVYFLFTALEIGFLYREISRKTRA